MAFSLYVCGWNGYGQWNSEGDEALPDVIDHFVKISGEKYFNVQKVEDLDLNIEWAYNIIVVNCKILIKGFHDDEFGKSVELEAPSNLTFTNCACNDKYGLFYNKSDSNIWKYMVDVDVQEKWKLLNFVNVEQDLESENDKIEVDKESLEEATHKNGSGKHKNDNGNVSKVISSIRMNVVYTSKGHLFDIPRKMDTSKFIGKIIDIQCGHEHAVLLTDYGNVYTWGCGSRCQLGHGDTESVSEPKLVEALSGVKVIKIAAGGWHCCAITEFQDLYVWGWNEKGQLGVFAIAEEVVITKVGDKTAEVVKNKTQDAKKLKIIKTPLENKALPNYATPILIDLYVDDKIIHRNIVDVGCGSKHTVIKLEDGTIWGSGCNKHSQLGFNSYEVPYFFNFKRLNVKADNVTVKCGTWGTALISNN